MALAKNTVTMCAAGTDALLRLVYGFPPGEALKILFKYVYVFFSFIKQFVALFCPQHSLLLLQSQSAKCCLLQVTPLQKT